MVIYPFGKRSSFIATRVSPSLPIFIGDDVHTFHTTRSTKRQVININNIGLYYFDYIEERGDAHAIVYVAVIFAVEKNCMPSGIKRSTNVGVGVVPYE